MSNDACPVPHLSFRLRKCRDLKEGENMSTLLGFLTTRNGHMDIYMDRACKSTLVQSVAYKGGPGKELVSPVSLPFLKSLVEC